MTSINELITDNLNIYKNLVILSSRILNAINITLAIELFKKQAIILKNQIKWFEKQNKTKVISSLLRQIVSNNFIDNKLENYFETIAIQCIQ
jgi:hypothetical protein